MDNAVRKNLIYYIYWDKTNGMLLKNLQQMNRYVDIFDGQRIIKISGIDELHPSITYIFPWLLNAEFIDNDPYLHEAPHFKESLSRLTDDGITFYSHAKGVSRPVNEPLLRWVDLMYKYNLSEAPDLSEKLFSGCFGKLRRGSDHVPVPWHYSGSFYWFRNGEVLRRYNSMEIPKEIDNRWFTENFPGWIAKQNEAEFKVYASSEMKYNLYSEEFWLRNKHLLK